MFLLKNIIVGQSGGPTAVINASLYGVIQEGQKHTGEINTIYGMRNGIEGFLKENVVNLSSLSEEELTLIKTTPAAYLGSCRYKLPEDLSDAVYPKLFQLFTKLEIQCFLYIGGNDSMDTVSKLSRYAKSVQSTICFIGIPKTIDNDLILTDHTPGYGSAAKFVAATVREISTDAGIYDKESVTIIEIMGRHAGWLTAASVLSRTDKMANPLFIYLPETAFDTETFLSDLKAAFTHTKNIVVCISEGIRDAAGTFICEYSHSVSVDTFGHKMLAGAGQYLEKLVKEKLSVKVRSIELNVTQRCSSAWLSATDINEAISAGSIGVQAALEGNSGKMIAFVRDSNTPYQLSYAGVDVNKVCNREKKVPLEWISENGTDLEPAFIEYCLPLIQGAPEVPTENGLPKFAFI